MRFPQEATDVQPVVAGNYRSPAERDEPLPLRLSQPRNSLRRLGAVGCQLLQPSSASACQHQRIGALPEVTQIPPARRLASATMLDAGASHRIAHAMCLKKKLLLLTNKQELGNYRFRASTGLAITSLPWASEHRPIGDRSPVPLEASPRVHGQKQGPDARRTCTPRFGSWPHASRRRPAKILSGLARVSPRPTDPPCRRKPLKTGASLFGQISSTVSFPVRWGGTFRSVTICTTRKTRMVVPAMAALIGVNAAAQRRVYRTMLYYPARPSLIRRFQADYHQCRFDSRLLPMANGRSSAALRPRRWSVRPFPVVPIRRGRRAAEPDHQPRRVRTPWRSRSLMAGGIRALRR